MTRMKEYVLRAHISIGVHFMFTTTSIGVNCSFSTGVCCSPLPQNAPSSSRSAEDAAFSRQHSGISDRNLSADFPYTSASLIARRWLSITWVQGSRYLGANHTHTHTQTISSGFTSLIPFQAVRQKLLFENLNRQFMFWWNQYKFVIFNATFCLPILAILSCCDLSQTAVTNFS